MKEFVRAWVATHRTERKDPRKRCGTAGVLELRRMGRGAPDDVPRDTGSSCPFRIAPREGVDPVEAGAVAGGFSAATPTVVWSDRLAPPCEKDRAKVYKVERLPHRSGEYFAWVADDIILLEEGSIASVTASRFGNLLSSKCLNTARSCATVRPEGERYGRP